MIDKRTESGIKAMKDFLELWAKFHSIYTGAISKDVISSDDEHKFLETKNIIKNKYEELKNSFDLKYMPHGRMTDPASDILSVETIRFISEKNLKKLENDWKDSYIFLNNIMERLKDKKRRLEDFNPIGVFFKRALERK